MDIAQRCNVEAWTCKVAGVETVRVYRVLGSNYHTSRRCMERHLRFFGLGKVDDVWTRFVSWRSDKPSSLKWPSGGVPQVSLASDQKPVICCLSVPKGPGLLQLNLCIMDQLWWFGAFLNGSWTSQMVKPFFHWSGHQKTGSIWWYFFVRDDFHYKIFYERYLMACH